MNKEFLKNLKVLLVEDEENLSSLLKASIGDNFCDFIIADNGNEGMCKFLEISPDIIITDIMMPELNGLEMAKEIRVANQDIPIIILSAFSEKEKLLSAIDIGITKYFIKPFDPDELLEYISTLNNKSKIIQLNDGFTFNIIKKSLHKDDKYIVLSKKEVTFIMLLLKDISNITDLETIKTELWKDSQGNDIRLRSLIKRFRIKTSKNILQNIKGRGYRFILP